MLHQTKNRPPAWQPAWRNAVDADRPSVDSSRDGRPHQDSPADAGTDSTFSALIWFVRLHRTAEQAAG
jgi:hypothetical protein